LDENIVPDLRYETAAHEVGRRRSFDAEMGFALSCAAALVTAGLQRSEVRVFMAGLTKLTFPSSKRLVIAAFFEEKPYLGVAEMGDNHMYILFRGPQGHNSTGWINLTTAVPARRKPSPLVTISLNIGRLGRQVFGWSTRA